MPNICSCVTQSSASTQRLGDQETRCCAVLGSLNCWGAQEEIREMQHCYLWDENNLNYPFKRLTSASPPADKPVTTRCRAPCDTAGFRKARGSTSSVSASICCHVHKPSLTCVAGSALRPVTLNYYICVTFRSRCSNYYMYTPRLPVRELWMWTEPGQHKWGRWSLSGVWRV